jgi:PAS domain S-box-containing protein
VSARPSPAAGTRGAPVPDASIPPYVPDDVAGAIAPLYRTPWARRWALAVLLLMLVWTALAWDINTRRYEDRVARAITVATAQARSRAALVEQGMRQGLTQLDGVARTLARSPQVAHAATAAGPGAVLARIPEDALRARLEAQPELAAMDRFLAVTAEDLGADLIYLLDDAGNTVASSSAGTPTSPVGAHVVEPAYLDQLLQRGSTREFAIGRVTGVPGLYFSAVVARDGRFAGAVVVKRNTPALAAMVGHEGAFVADAQGVVILAQDPGLLLRSLPDARVATMDPATRESRYRHERLPELRIAPWPGDPGGALRVIGDDPVPQVLVQRHMVFEALDVYVAQPLPEIEVLAHERLADFALLSVAGAGAIALVAAGLGGWRARRQVLQALDHVAAANHQLSVQMAERQRAEALLRESREVLEVHEARLRAVLRNLPEQVWMKDRAGAYLAVNAEFERFQGRPAGEFLGRTDHDFEPPERAQRFADQDRAALAAAEPLVFDDVDRPAGGGGRRQLQIIKSAVRDDRGQVIGVVGIARDMTDILAAHEALKTSEARFRATFETAGDAILIIRRAVVVDCNSRAAQLLGAASRAELLGRPMALLGPERQPGGELSRVLAARHVEAVRDGGQLTAEWRCRRLDGSEFDAEITLSVFEHGGQRLLQSVLRDVSERKRMIAALESAKEEAERANRSKSVFLANMSHEIRTPLNAVLGFTQLLLADSGLPAHVQSRLRVIHSAGNRLLGLINDVLDLAKIESGGLQVALAPFDLLQELRDIDHLYGAHARAKGLALQTELTLAAPAVVMGDRTKVGQIVSNLLGNALKFTERGHVGLHAWREPGAAERVWIEVTDTGAGISPAELGELFVPFRQGAAGQEKGGTGLGLVLSRDMARAMGGDLAVTSAPGAGTRVRVWLPLPPTAGAPAGAALAAGAQVLAAGTRCRVLVIEDDADSRVVLVNLLREAGCEVDEALDGEDGLAMCRARPYDLVFSDIRMPRLNGVEMMRRLRADPATRGLPVIAVSASSLEHERRFYVDNGFRDFIGKPYPFQDVYRALVEHGGARLAPAAPPAAGGAAQDADAPAEAPPPDPAGLPPLVREQLRELAEAASRGQLAAVRRLMAALAPAAIGRARWRDFDEAAQAYDFQQLEARVRELLAQARGG